MTELGNRLKETRELKKLSLDDLQRMTKIQKRYLVGIEEGNYSVMPGKFYVRAFIKQYAEAVELDPEELFEEFKDEIPSTTNEQLPEQLSRVRSKRQISAKGSKILDMVPVLILVVFIIGGLFTAWWLLQRKDVAEAPEETIIENSQSSEYQETNEIPPADTPDETESGQEEPVEDGAETEDEVEEEEPEPAFTLSLVESSGNNVTYKLENTDTFNVEVSASTGGETWLDIKNQLGKSFYYAMLRDGNTETFDFSNESQINFNVGRTLDTTILINGQPFEYPVEPSEQVSQRFTIIYEPTQE
nr:RodZ family helix-turn-helix domain-containing protein [Bacillus sp. PS06]